MASTHPVFEWANQHYVPGPGVIYTPEPGAVSERTFYLFVRKGSDLEKRLKADLALTNSQ
jgi:hypothetical protein